MRLIDPRKIKRKENWYYFDPSTADNYNLAVSDFDELTINILNDTIVGFRYLNGGNGSAHLREVTFLSVNEINKISSSSSPVVVGAVCKPSPFFAICLCCSTRYSTLAGMCW